MDEQDIQYKKELISIHEQAMKQLMITIRNMRDFAPPYMKIELRERMEEAQKWCEEISFSYPEIIKESWQLFGLAPKTDPANSVIDETKKTRTDYLKEQLENKYKLLDEWERKHFLAENPTELLRCEVEIEKIKSSIARDKK